MTVNEKTTNLKSELAGKNFYFYNKRCEEALHKVSKKRAKQYSFSFTFISVDDRYRTREAYTRTKLLMH